MMSVSAHDASALAEYKWAFVLAHPGHELRAHHFAELTRPQVSVLTDGSGSTGQSRLSDSTDLLATLGARRGPVFGPMTDHAAYACLKRGDLAPFLEIANRIANHFVADGITAALTDAAEGYNPTHDVCHWIARAAAARARQQGQPVRLFEFDLTARPNTTGSGLPLHLDDVAFTRKLTAISRYRAIAGDVAALFQAYGIDSFRDEFARDVPPGIDVPPADVIPPYEQVGEERVRQGLYDSVLRYGQHVRPIIQALSGG